MLENMIPPVRQIVAPLDNNLDIKRWYQCITSSEATCNVKKDRKIHINSLEINPFRAKTLSNSEVPPLCEIDVVINSAEKMDKLVEVLAMRICTATCGT